METNKTQNEITLKSEFTRTPLRLQMVRLLQVLGVLAGFMGGADYLDLVALLPDVAWSKWLLVSGPAFAAAVKPVVLLVGDIVDDGLRNDSFKITVVVLPFLCLMCFWSTSCGQVSLITPYGDFHSSKAGDVTYTPPSHPVTIPVTRSTK